MDFSTDEEFQKQLDWVREFSETEIAPLELLWPHLDHRIPPPWLKKVIDPLKQQVKDRGLWACHLGPELGGQGYGQLKLCLINEIIAKYAYKWGPVIFGVQAPDTGNAEILAHYGTPAQKERYLAPLLAGEIFSGFSMTEPQGGSDPTLFTCRADRDGDSWVINGEKFFTSNASHSSFLIVMAVSNAEVHPYKGMSMFLVPIETPGLQILRQTRQMGEAVDGDAIDHPHIRYENVRVPADALLGEEGQGFTVAQTRLSGGRLHHAMRAIGQVQSAFDMMCERALSRRTHDKLIGQMQITEEAIAESYAQIEQFRLFVLRTAWKVDQGHGYNHQVRKDIAVAKMLSAQVMQDVMQRAIHIHGALGVSNEMPLGEMWMRTPSYALWDGATEVHVTTAARQVLKDYTPSPDLWPTQWLPRRVEEARTKFAQALAEQTDWELAEAAAK